MERRWFQDSNDSFPSAEATHADALVTHYILEYGDDHPEIYCLLVIPVYVGPARLRIMRTGRATSWRDED